MRSRNRVRGLACVYDAELYGMSRGELGYDFCVGSVASALGAEFRDGVYIFEDSFEHWNNETWEYKSPALPGGSRQRSRWTRQWWPTAIWSSPRTPPTPIRCMGRWRSSTRRQHAHSRKGCPNARTRPRWTTARITFCTIAPSTLSGFFRSPSAEAGTCTRTRRGTGASSWIQNAAAISRRGACTVRPVLPGRPRTHCARSPVATQMRL